MDEHRETDLSDRMDAAAAEIADLRSLVERAIALRGEIRELVIADLPEAV